MIRVILTNPLNRALTVEVDAVEDTDLPEVRIPSEIIGQLGIENRIARRKDTYCGPLEIRYGDRVCYAGAIAGGIGVAIGYGVYAELEDRPQISPEKLGSLTRHWLSIRDLSKRHPMSPGLEYASDSLLTLLEQFRPTPELETLRRRLHQPYYPKLALEVAAAAFGREAALAWMAVPQAGLGGQTPEEMCSTEEGMNRVVEAVRDAARKQSG